MPVATIDPTEYTRFELKSAPADPSVPGDENGFIELRPMPYGMRLERRDKASTMKMRAIEGRPSRSGRGSGQPDNAGEITIETASEWATHFDYAYCVGEHNLTDANGVKLDFTKSMALKQLHPRIGAEIERLLFDLNEEEDAETLEDFLQRSVSSSETEAPTFEGASIEPLHPVNADT